MKSRNQFSLNRLAISVALFLLYIPVDAQLYGPSSIEAGTSGTYNYNNGVAVTSPVWTVSGNGSITSTAISGFNYSAVVRWNTVGSGTLKLKSDTVTKGTAHTTVTGTISSPIGIGNSRCGTGGLTITASVGAGGNQVRWYTASTGGSPFQTTGSYTPTLSASTTYYIASYNSTTLAESTPRIPITATINPSPTATPGAIGNIRFGAGAFVLTGTGTPTGGSYKWYSSIGAFLSGAPSYSTPIIYNSTSNYIYAKAVSSAGCEGIVQGWVSVTITPLPTITSSNPYVINGGNVTLDAGSGYASYVWKNSAGVSVGAAQSYSTNILDSYTVDVTKSGVTGTGTSIPFKVRSQLDGQDKNYISTYVFKEAIANSNWITHTSVDSATLSVQYFDGLGRTVQSVSAMSSPARKDIVQPVVYDALGRETTKYLPYVSSDSSGRYKTNATGTGAAQEMFYSTANNLVARSTKAFSQTVLDDSPLERNVAQGAPGVQWQPDGSSTYTSPQANDHSLRFTEDFNVTSEVLLFTYDQGTGLLGWQNDSSGYYEASQLTAKRTKDEHHHETILFTDKNGRMICKKVQYATSAGVKKYAETYYVYDDAGNLVVVMQPQGVKQFLDSQTN